MPLGKGKNCWETSPGTWAYSFNVKGQRFTGTIKNSTKREAERWVRQEKDRIRLRLAASAQTPSGQAPKDITLMEAVSRFITEVGQYTKNGSEDEVHFDRLLQPDWVGETTMISCIDDDLVAKLISKRREMYRHDKPQLGRLSNAYVNRTVTDMLRRVLGRAKTVWKIPLPNEPNWSEHLLPERVRVREMRYEEETVLAASARQDFWPAIQFAIITGLRRMNVTGLTWDQVDRSAGVIRVVTKGGYHREILITQDVADILDDQTGKHATAVFTYQSTKTWTNPKTNVQHYKGQFYPLTYSGYQSAWRSLCKQAGVRNLTIHDLRKTAGSRILRATGNLKAAQMLLGHRNIAQTADHYAFIAPEDLAEGMAAAAAVTKAKRDAIEAQPNVASQKILKSRGSRAA